MSGTNRTRPPRRRGLASRSRVPQRELRCPVALQRKGERRVAPTADDAARLRRVEQFRDAVLRGSYRVDPLELAEVLLRDAADYLLQ